MVTINRQIWIQVYSTAIRAWLSNPEAWASTSVLTADLADQIATRIADRALEKANAPEGDKSVR